MDKKDREIKPRKAKQKPLSVKRRRLVEELARPNVKSVAEAGRKAGFSASVVRSDIYAIAALPEICEAVQQRISRALKHSKVSPEEVIGSAAFQMRSSLNDVLDADGSFSIEKARETGAVDLLKKHKETVKTSYNTETKSVETTKTVEVEMLTNQDARKEVANYIGVENFAPKTPTGEELARALYDYLLERLAHLPQQKIIEAVVKKYPQTDPAKLLEAKHQ